MTDHQRELLILDTEEILIKSAYLEKEPLTRAQVMIAALLRKYRVEVKP